MRSPRRSIMSPLGPDYTAVLDKAFNGNWIDLYPTAGKRSGALTVGVLCGFGERTELERLQPNLLLDTTTQLGQHLPREEQTWCDNW